MLKKFYVFLIIMSSLTAGLMIYVNGRAHHLILHRILDQIGILNFLTIDSLSFLIEAPDWIRFQLPDGLWMLALVLSIRLIWGFNKSRAATFWVLSAVVVALVYEWLQQFGLTPGTYDFKDLIALVIASAFGLLISD